MSFKKKTTSILLMAAMAFTLCACGQQNIPTSTSTEWGIYAKNINGTKAIVDEEGVPSFDYAFDKKGNVIDKNKTIIIGAENLYNFVDVSDISVKDESALNIVLDTEIVEKEIETSGVSALPTLSVVRETVPVEKTSTIEIAISPENATSRKLTVTSSNADVAKLSGSGDSNTVNLDGTKTGGVVSLEFVSKDEGAAQLTVASADGSVKKNFTVNVELSDKPINADSFKSEPEPSADTLPERNDITGDQTTSTASTTVAVTPAIATTENTPGWINGSKVNLREEPSTSSNINGTYSSGKELTILGNASGWSKVLIDGQTGYVKTVYVTTTNPNPATTTATNNSTQNSTGVYVNNNAQNNTNSGANRSTYYNGNSYNGQTSSNGSNGTNQNQAVNAPIASNDGYDHGYAFSNEAAAAGSSSHEHDYKLVETIQPTPNSKGYSVYRCSCGATYKGDYTDYTGSSGSVHIHHYTQTVIGPTCDEIGYTLYTCSECGDSYKDNFVNATGHTFSSTDLGDGSVVHTCSECGYSYIE